MEKIINKNNTYNYNLVIARLFYADYYFDLVEDIFLEKKNQLELNYICDIHILSNHYWAPMTWQINKELNRCYFCLLKA